MSNERDNPRSDAAHRQGVHPERFDMAHDAQEEVETAAARANRIEREQAAARPPSPPAAADEVPIIDETDREPDHDRTPRQPPLGSRADPLR